MAYDRDYVQLIGPSGGRSPSLWSYISTDALAVVEADDYFVLMSNELRVGDMIHSVDPATGGVDAPLTLTTATLLIVTKVVKASAGVTGEVDTIANAWTIA